MSQPDAYNRFYNFANFQAANPASPIPAGPLDIEFSRIKAVIDQIRTSIRLMQRDDFAIGNDTIGLDQLKPEVSVGLNPPTIWSTGINYVARDTVITGSIFYQCVTSHVSGVFATDLAAGKWTILADFTAVGTPSATLTSYDNSTSGLAASNVQAAIDEVVAESDSPTITSGTIDNTPIGASVPSTGRFTTLVVGTESVFPTPFGAIMDFAGAAAPSKWLLCYGQAISRSTYAALFAVLSTTYGVGDGTTTFNLPDYRGRVGAGQDDMGGVSANRLTGVSGGVDGDALGGVGGEEAVTLNSATMPAHTHTGTTGNGSANHIHSGILVSSSAGVSSSTAVQGGTANGASIETGLSGSAHTHSFTTASTGSGGAHNNVQPTIILNKIIYAGV